ncbi:MAG TPA: ABC transporter substrate-binding protein [Gaiellaceae bacterium]|nr:ABC transporter substrate-binding protein [Gaiellaceae bacterium]
MSRLNRTLAVALTALSLVPALARPVVAAASAREVVQRMTDAALKVLRDESLSADDKLRRLEDIAATETDFDTMSRLVLGRNWSRFSPEQQAEFVKQFKEHLKVTYGRNIENYRNERVEVVGDRQEERDDWTVKTKILRGGGAADILVDYRLRKSGDTWRVIDIIIERVSLVANFRSQLQELVTQGGPQKVLDVLRERNARGEPLQKS